MKIILMLCLLLMSNLAIGRLLTISWDNAPGNPVGTTTELTVNEFVYPDNTGSSLVIDISLSPGQTVNVKARSVNPDYAESFDYATLTYIMPRARKRK